MTPEQQAEIKQRANDLLGDGSRRTASLVARDALTLLSALSVAQEDTERLRTALAGAVEAMRPRSVVSCGIMCWECEYCQQLTTDKSAFIHAADCSFELAYAALTAGEA